jgi:hypothetical protein
MKPDSGKLAQKISPFCRSFRERGHAATSPSIPIAWSERKATRRDGLDCIAEPLPTDLDETDQLLTFNH